MSASPISQVVIGNEQKYLAERQAKLLNCSTDTSKQIIDCLKTKSWRELGNSLDNMFVSFRYLRRFVFVLFKLRFNTKVLVSDIDRSYCSPKVILVEKLQTVVTLKQNASYLFRGGGMLQLP